MIGVAGRRLAAAAATLVLAFAAVAAGPGDPIPVPSLTGRVVDLTGTLSEADRHALAARLQAFEASKGSQVAVLLVPSTGTEAIEDFATRVTDEWKLGRAGVDDGVLFVIAKQDRRLRIQTGRGVQGVLTDALSKRIIAERVSPRFKAGDFAGGISEGVESILRAIEGETLPEPVRESRSAGGQAVSFATVETFAFAAFALVPLVGSILRAIAGRFLGAVLTAGAAGFVAWLFFASVLGAVLAAALVFVVVLFMGMPSVGARRGGGGWSSGGGGWSSGGGGWSSGGGGGFSGGGGGFDGGGASGDW